MEELVMLLLGFGILLFFIAVVLLIIYILAYWMIFNKAGEPGWKALIQGRSKAKSLPAVQPPRSSFSGT